MADWGFADYSYQTIAGTGAFSRGGTISAHTSTNTKGCFRQVSPPQSFDSEWLSIGIGGRIQTTGRSLVDIAAGTQGGSQETILSGLPLPGNTETFIHYTLPLHVSSMTPLSAALQSNVAGVSASVSVSLHGAGFAKLASHSYAKVYGSSASVSNLTEVAPGATNVKGSWVEICNSLDFNASTILIMAVPFATMTDCDMFLDVGIGDLGSEQVLIGDIALGGENADNSVSPNTIGPLPFGQPASARISARLQSSGASSVGVGFIALAN